MSDRKIVHEKVGAISVSEMDYMTLGEAAEMFQEYVETYGADCEISKEWYEYPDTEYWSINKPREENDDEYNARMNREAEQKRYQQERDKAEYERLKKQFGD